jgi:site-specific recombinase XerD
MTLSVVTHAVRTSLETLIEDYLADLQARGLSRRTVRQAGHILHSVLGPWCREQEITTIEQLDQRALNAFTTHLLSEGGPRGELARRSVHSYARQVNSLLAWAGKVGERASTAKAHAPKLERKVLDVLSRDELHRLEEAARTERDRVLVKTLADTGLRLSEALGLRDEDLIEQGRQRFVRVHGKGAKDRLVPLMPQLYRRLAAYAQRGRPKDVGTSHIFTSLRRGRDGSYAPLASRTVQDMILQAAQDAGITKPVHAHLIRHSYATWALRSGRMNVVELQRILGHADLSQITQTYSHLVAGDLFEAAVRLHSEER